MNKTYFKLKKLRALSLMINEIEAKKAKEKIKKRDLYSISYNHISVDFVDIDSSVSISIFKWEIDFQGEIKLMNSWNEIPHDTLFESYEDISEMRNESHEDFSEVTTFIRKVAKVGFDNLKFGKYTRSYRATNYLDFEDK